jgi:hypothetical protein
MFASKRLTYHARDAKVLLVKFPQAQKLINDSFLLSEAGELGNITWLIEHSAEIEIATK